MQREVLCPACRKPTVIPIVYGMPDADLLRQAERGEIYLGGPDDGEANENWHCVECDLNFR